MTEGENCYKELRSAGTAKKEILIPLTFACGDNIRRRIDLARVKLLVYKMIGKQNIELEFLKKKYKQIQNM